MGNDIRYYTEEEVKKAIDLSRGIFDGKDSFTAEDISGCTEVCTYDWKFEYSVNDIIKLINN